MTSTATITITTFPNRWQTTPDGRRDRTLAELAAELATAPVTSTPKDALAFWNGAVFREGGRRCNADVVTVTAAFLDHDGTHAEIEPFLAELAERGLEYLVIPSPSHFDALDSGKYKIRVIVPYSQPVKAEEHRRVWAWLNARAGGVLDRQTKAPSQGYCVPACKPEHADSWWTRHEPGEALDVVALLAAMPGDAHSAPGRAPTHHEIERYSHVAEPAIDDYLETLPEQVAAGDRHRTLFLLAQRCRDWGIDPERHVQRYNLAHCNPPKTSEELARVLDNPDAYRWHPVGFELARVAFIGLDQKPTIDRAIESLAEQAAELYERERQLVTLADDGSITAANEHRVGELVSHHVKLYRHVRATQRTPAHWTPASVPVSLPKQILARGRWPRVRALEGVINMPSMRRDGSIIVEPGYDVASGLFYRPQNGMRVDIPEGPTFEQGKVALGRVAKLFEQFPFEEDAMRAAHLALVASTVARPMIDGPIPVGIFDANRSQCGKSKLTAAVALIMTGELPARKAWHENDTTMADQLFASAMTGDRVLYFDNVRNGSTIESAALDGGLTSMRIAQRRRYTDILAPVTFKPIVLVSGNGIRVGGDMEARAVYVRLVSELEDPTARIDIEIPDLLGHIKRRRGEIVSDLLTAWSAWLGAGRPGEVKPWHTFEAWGAVRAMLGWYGYADPLDTRAALRALDETTDLLRGLLDYIAQHFPAREGDGQGRTSSVGGCTAGRLLEHLRRSVGGIEHGEAAGELLAGLARGRGEGALDARALGIALRGYKDRVCGGRRLVRTTVGGKPRWSVR